MISRRRLLSRAVLGTAALGASRAIATNARAGIDDRIAVALRDGTVPGIAIAIVRAGRTRFSRGYGMASIADRASATAHTAFHLASVSKIVTGTVLMGLWQDGAFALDEPIQRRLDFPVGHPAWLDVPITFRHLFTHSSGISDAGYGATAFSAPPLDAVPLRNFLAGYLVPGGRWYGRTSSFMDARPGEAWAYSNVGIALAGYLAERMDGRSLAVQSAARISRPLALRETAWSPQGLGRTAMATAYERRGAGGFTAIPPVRYPDYPAGMVRASAHDLARLVACYMPGGGFPILRQDTVSIMLETRPLAGLPDATFQAQGLFWAWHRIGRIRLIAHYGGDPGAYTLAAMTPDCETGFVLLSNATPNRAARLLFDDLADMIAVGAA